MVSVLKMLSYFANFRSTTHCNPTVICICMEYICNHYSVLGVAVMRFKSSCRTRVVHVVAVAPGAERLVLEHLWLYRKALGDESAGRLVTRLSQHTYTGAKQKPKTLFEL